MIEREWVDGHLGRVTDVNSVLNAHPTPHTLVDPDQKAINSPFLWRLAHVLLLLYLWAGPSETLRGRPRIELGSPTLVGVNSG